MKYLFCLLTLSLSTMLSAQTVVVPISPEDARLVKDTKEQLDAANRRWENLQKDIGKKYLVVAKDSPDAGNQRYYDDVTLTGMTSGTVSASSLFTAVDPCLTPEERAKRDRDRATYEEEQRRLDDEREAKSRRIHKGFDSERDFIFSGDWKYLLPMEKPPEPVHNNGIYLYPNSPQGWDPGTTIFPR